MTTETKPVWRQNAQGCWECVLRGTFVIVMRADDRSWRWLGFANGRVLGEFNGLALAKREALRVALLGAKK